MRKLVTVRRVSAVHPIAGADRIETAQVGGWQCVVRKGDFSVGQLGVFFEIDSFLPASDKRFAFLSGGFITWGGRHGYRVRTVRTRGQVSQGLLLPLDSFPEIVALLEERREVLRKDGGADGLDEAGVEKDAMMNMSFEELLGVVKYEQQDFGSQGPDKYYDMPVFIRKTDQMRCQNLPDLFDEWGTATFQETTKMDGASMTVYFVGKDSPHIANIETPPVEATEMPNGRVGVASRNKEQLSRRGNRLWDVTEANGLPSKLSKLGRNLAIQGELCGSSIQKNLEGFAKDHHDFYLFSVWDIDKQSYLPPKEAEAMAAELQIQHVPVNGYYVLGEIAKDLEDLVKRADGTGINGKKREGIVFKHVDGEFSFKAISNQYLLKHGE